MSLRRILLAAAGSVTNWLQSQKPAPNFGTVLTARLADNTVAASVSQSSSALKVDEKPAGSVVLIEIDLVHGSFVLVGSNGAGVAWTNPTNVQGANDGVFATTATGATPTTATLSGTTPAQPNRPTQLTIDDVQMSFYGKTVTVGASDSLVLAYNVAGDALDTALQTITTALAFTATPLTFSLLNAGKTAFSNTAASAKTWANIATLISRWKPVIVPVTGTMVASADAVKLIVTAHDTWIPPAS